MIGVGVCCLHFIYRDKSYNSHMLPLSCRLAAVQLVLSWMFEVRSLVVSMVQTCAVPLESIPVGGIAFQAAGSMVPQRSCCEV